MVEDDVTECKNAMVGLQLRGELLHGIEIGFKIGIQGVLIEKGVGGIGGSQRLRFKRTFVRSLIQLLCL